MHNLKQTCCLFSKDLDPVANLEHHLNVTICSLSYYKHPPKSIFFPASFQFWGAGAAGAYPSCQGTPWIGRRPIAGLTLKDRQTFTLTHTYSQFRQIISPKSMSLDRGRKPECPEKTHTCTGRTYKLHTERPEPRNPKPSCCETTVLTTAPPCRPYYKHFL